MKEKKNKNKKPSLWMIKNINHGDESKELGFYHGSIIAFFPLEVVYIFWLGIGLLYEIILVFIALALSVWLYRWLRSKVRYLEICRETAILEYESVKTEEEKEMALSKMQELRIPNPNDTKKQNT